MMIQNRLNLGTDIGLTTWCNTIINDHNKTMLLIHLHCVSMHQYTLYGCLIMASGKI